MARERSAGAYRVSSYYISKSLTEIVISSVFPLLHGERKRRKGRGWRKREMEREERERKKKNEREGMRERMRENESERYQPS